jgi:NADP-dependent aldehyde dehydrogenase
MSALHGKNFIADRLVDGAETFTVASPLDGTTLDGTFHVASVKEVDAAVHAADGAFATFRDSTPEQRAALLERIADEIVALGDALLERAHRETGLPLPRLTGERGRTVAQLRMFAQVARDESWIDARIDPALPNRQPLPRPDLRRMLRPIGPVVVFGASNFPLAFSVAGGDTASALATGNPVVVKAHERHPGTSELVAGAIQRAVAATGLPAGVFSMLHGTGATVGRALVQHPFTRAVGFTGSRTAGRALFDAAASRPEPIPVFAEMSSLNPVFVLPQALRERGATIAAGLANSVTLGVGQFCTKPGLVFGADSADFGHFKQQFAEKLKAVAPATMLHSGICASYQKLVARAEALTAAKPLARAPAGDPTRTHGAAVALEIDVGGFIAHPDAAEEIFGPFAWIVTGQSLAELERAAEHLEGQLTATVHGTPDDLREAAALLRILERKAGRLIVNGFPTGVEVSPAMNHGGPYPATTDVRFTSVGTAALLRFVRPVCYQDFPADLLPPALRNENPRGLWRTVDGKATQAAVP